MSATLQFLGAARTVTGSKHLLQVSGKQYLIDCGLFQGSRNLSELNWKPLPVGAHEIDAVLITHAHIDHIGYLPRLWKDGFRGPIYCTKATADITRLSLPDSGELQEEFARYANKKGFSRHKPALPLYTADDAYAVCKLLEPINFDENYDLAGKCVMCYRRAGHILGSAFIEFFLPDGRKILFSGDLGRFDTAIIRDPEIIEAADILLIESTYGDRVHSSESAIGELEAVLHHAVEVGGMVIIPAFAIGRTQEVLYMISQLQREGRLPKMPMFVDSPMAIDATSIYAKHHDDHDLEMEELEDDNRNPLRPQDLIFARKVNESKKINELRGPALVIASSGMANGGRVVHHLHRRLANENNTVLFVGYQAAGTLGRELVDGAGEVEIMGDWIPVRASIRKIDSLSAHADSNEIMSWLSKIKLPPKMTYVVHGEPGPMKSLSDRIRVELGWATHMPELFEAVAL
ncbi:MAG: MBL fold metallo-hydrolase [Armatimonadota bacterium]|nr:MBL fold metallo-hydrolase [Armatimonadota bacterium]